MSDRGVYSRARPPDHVGICWAAALGYARQGMGIYNGQEKNAADALAHLAEYPEDCICPRRSTRNRRPRR